MFYGLKSGFPLRPANCCGRHSQETLMNLADGQAVSSGHRPAFQDLSAPSRVTGGGGASVFGSGTSCKTRAGLLKLTRSERGAVSPPA